MWNIGIFLVCCGLVVVMFNRVYSFIVCGGIGYLYVVVIDFFFVVCEINVISIIFICNIFIFFNINRKLCVVVVVIIGDSEIYFGWCRVIYGYRYLFLIELIM